MRGRDRRALALPPLPRPPPLEFELERHAQKRPDENDDREDANAAKRRLDGNRADYVGSDEELEAEQNRPSDTVAVAAEGRLSVVERACASEEEGRSR